MPRFLRQFKERFPTTHVDLRELTSREQIESLHARKIDLGIVRLPLADAADITLHPIEVERFIAVLPCDHRLAGVSELRLKDLSNESFMAFPPDKIASLHAKFLMACEESGFSPRIALDAWQMSSMVSLVAAGMGVALLPAQVRKIPYEGVVYKELADQSKHIELKIAMAWRPDDVHEDIRSMLAMAGNVGMWACDVYSA